MALLSPLTMGDFPPEIIELFLPDYHPSTISTLKLVNKQFYNVFSRDRFFKYFLLYPESFYLSDLNFDSKAHGVKEIVENIKKGVWGKWEGYFRLQKAHLDNLKSGRIDSFDIINVTGEDNAEGGELAMSEELLDGNNEHWLCCAFRSGQVAMINLVTNRWLRHNLGDFHTVHFLPGLMLVRKVDLTFAVYKVVDKDGAYSFELQYEAALSEARVMEQWPFTYALVSGTSNSTSTMRNHLFGWETSDNKGTFCIWDLDTDAKSVLSIGQLLDTREANQVARFFQGDFPNVIVLVSYLTEERLIVLYVFNIESKRITHRLGNWTKVFLNDVAMNSNIVSVCFENGDDLRIFRLPQSRPGVVCDAELIYSVTAPLLCHFLSATRIVWIKENVGHILHVGSSGIEEKEFRVPADQKFVGFFIPSVILLKYRFDPFFYNGLLPIRAVNLTGEHLFDMEVRSDFPCEVLFTRHTWWYPSRLVNPLNSRLCTSHSFKIYHF